MFESDQFRYNANYNNDTGDRFVLRFKSHYSYLIFNSQFNVNSNVHAYVKLYGSVMFVELERKGMQTRIALSS